MKVKEAIEELQKIDPEAEVIVTILIYDDTLDFTINSISERTLKNKTKIAQVYLTDVDE